MTHNQLKRILWHTACPIEVDEPDMVICQSCQEMFIPMGDEWFCPDCEERLSAMEKAAQIANIRYWMEHGHE